MKLRARKVDPKPSTIDWTFRGFTATNDAGEERYFELVRPLRFRIGDNIEITTEDWSKKEEDNAGP